MGESKKKGLSRPRDMHNVKKNEELTSHLFGTCNYVGKVWMEVARKLSKGTVTRREYTWEKNTKQWWDNKVVCEFISFPMIFVFTIWEARNRAIFKNT